MLMDCEQIREAVQIIAQTETEKTADRLRAFNLLYGWSRAEVEELPPWLRNGAGVNGVKVTVNMIDEETGEEYEESFPDSWEQ